MNQRAFLLLAAFITLSVVAASPSYYISTSGREQCQYRGEGREWSAWSGVTPPQKQLPKTPPPPHAPPLRPPCNFTRAGYLSTKACASSQDVVDEWPVLDGSGRQQWRLVLPPGAAYSVTGGPVYLQVRRCCWCCS